MLISRFFLDISIFSWYKCVKDKKNKEWRIKMSLIKCPECKKEISDQAEKCIYCGYPIKASNASSNTHFWRCPTCGNMINQEPCPFCSSQESKKEESTSNENADSQTIPQEEPVKRGADSVQRKSNGTRVVLRIIGITLMCLFYLNLFNPAYYVAKMPGYEFLKVDGYLHKSKSCCQKAADFVGGKVIRVRAKQKAGTNSLGQTVHYIDTYNLCPLCN